MLCMAWPELTLGMSCPGLALGMPCPAQALGMSCLGLTLGMPCPSLTVGVGQCSLSLPPCFFVPVDLLFPNRIDFLNGSLCWSCPCVVIMFCCAFFWLPVFWVHSVVLVSHCARCMPPPQLPPPACLHFTFGRMAPLVVGFQLH